MNVQELIAALKSCHPNAPVHVSLESHREGKVDFDVSLPVESICQWSKEDDTAPVEIQVNQKERWGYCTDYIKLARKE